MKNLGIRSPYAKLGIQLTIGCFLFAAFFSRDRSTTPKIEEYVITANTLDPSFNPEIAWRELPGYLQDEEEAAAKKWLDTKSSTPCFEVAIDETVDGYADDYRTDLFASSYIATQQDLITRIETGLSASFLDKTWELDKDCFSGSFVVSFDVAEDGTLGKNMLVHHVRGGSNNAGFAVLEVLWDMERKGHTWHDGSQGTGEVRIPIRFQLI